MKKILVLANNDVGLYNFRKELIEKLLLENEVYISLPYGKKVEPLKEMGCKFIETRVDRRGTNIVKDIKLLINYIKMLKKIKPDVVLTYTIKPNIYGGIVCSLLKIPFIVNITGVGTGFANGGLVSKLTVFLYKGALKKASCVFFQNEENKQIFEDKIYKGRSMLIPGSGVNLAEFSPLEYPFFEKTEFAFISRIMKEKGIEQYIYAAKKIKQTHPDTTFHICGFCESDYEDEIKRLDDTGIIKYHGMVDDVRQILKRIHCTIHPTYYPEGMSNVLLESLACARPIITTDRAGCREIVENGVNGYVIKQQDGEDLVKKIEIFLNLSCDERMKMGILGRQKAEKEFNRQIVIDRYIEVIEQI